MDSETLLCVMNVMANANTNSSRVVAVINDELHVEHYSVIVKQVTRAGGGPFPAWPGGSLARPAGRIVGLERGRPDGGWQWFRALQLAPPPLVSPLSSRLRPCLTVPRA